jgi:hypothetical protein
MRGRLGRSFAVAGEMLFYHSKVGGSRLYRRDAVKVAEAFGDEKYRDAAAGSDGRKYYVSMKDTGGNWHIFVYDTAKAFGTGRTACMLSPCLRRK